MSAPIINAGFIAMIAGQSAVAILGTGTGVGKTVATGVLLGQLRQQGYPALSMKWVQTGLASDPLDTDRHDAIAQLIAPDYRSDVTSDIRTPYQFQLSASPHLAAALTDTVITLDRCRDAMTELKDFCPLLIEGSGGILVPVSENEPLIEWVQTLKLPIIVVTSTELGTLNATALTLDALRMRGILPLGMVINSVTPMETVVTADNGRMISRMADQQGISWISLPWQGDYHR
jgi:dethiobiotin synthetase